MQRMQLTVTLVVEDENLCPLQLLNDRLESIHLADHRLCPVARHFRFRCTVRLEVGTLTAVGGDVLVLFSNLIRQVRHEFRGRDHEP